MKTINFSKIISVVLRKSFHVSMLGLTSAVLLGVSACSTGFDEPVTKKDQSVTKDYNYLFKVIVPEEIMRSMTDDQHERMVAKIEKMGSILDKQIDRKYRNVEDVTVSPAAVGAVVFVSKELRDTVDNLAQDGVMILFPYDELLADNSSPVEIEVGTQNDERLVGAPGRVFVYEGQNSPRDNTAWRSEENPLRAVTFESQNTAVNTSGSDTMRLAKDSDVVENFFGNLVDNIVSIPAVSMYVPDSEVASSDETDGVNRGAESQDSAITLLKTDSSVMVIELEGDRAVGWVTRYF